MKGTAAPAPDDGAVEEALQSLLYLRSYEAFEEWLGSHGPKERSAVLRVLLRKRSERHGGLSYIAWLDLLPNAGSDPREAWQKREAEAQAVESFMQGLDEAMEGVTDALSRGKIDSPQPIDAPARERRRFAPGSRCSRSINPSR